VFHTPALCAEVPEDRGTVPALAYCVRREDSNAIESRLRDRDRDAFGTAEYPVAEAPPPPPPNAEAQPSQDGGQQEQAQQQQQSAAQSGSDGDLFAALGEALDEIEAEQKATTKEILSPTQDRVELIPAIDTMYKRMTRSFICSVDPPLSATPREPTKHGPLINAFDKSLEDLLTDSLLRARHQFEQRRALHDGRLIGRNR